VLARVEGLAGREAPDGKGILPGVVGHSTNVVEHPELVPTGSQGAELASRQLWP